ncbi:MAG: aldo/keto reductase [Steroidobacteraceae bacterium]
MATNPPATQRIRTRSLGQTNLALSEVGFGTVPVGNLYHPVDDVQARGALEAALAAGITFFDTAPYYGYGLSERRVGDVLRDRSGFVLSTKVGRLLEPAPGIKGASDRRGFCSSFPFEPRFDYSYGGIMRSYEDSLQRLGLAHIDILLIHDIGALTHGDRHRETFDQLTGGGLRALEELRRAGDITAVGVGVNEVAVCLELMRSARIDLILLAGRYTLLEQTPLDELFPLCRTNGVRIIIGGPYNSGILATGTRGGASLHYNYAAAPQEIATRVRALEMLCDRYKIPLAAAALQFPLAHPHVVSVIPGLESAEHVAQTVQLYNTRIPSEFWEALRSAGHLRADAPVPGAPAPA